MEKSELPTARSGQRRGARRSLVAATAALVAVVSAVLLTAGASASVNGAAFTTDNPQVTSACLNGGSHSTPAVNCNIYGAKQDVWINGGPSNGANHLTDGTYFFAVLEPGGQPSPNDGGSKNLSDINAAGGTNDTCGDAYTNRTFTVSGGHISSYTGDGTDYYGGTAGDPANSDACTAGGGADPHVLDTTNGGSLGNLIQLWPYDTTGNPGGVYILAICRLTGTTYPVDPRDCKYDAFKVRSGTPTTGEGSPLDIVKDANPAFTREFNWTVGKGVDACQVTLLNPNGCSVTSSTKTLNYTVTVTKDSGHDGGWHVSGTITVSNPNAADVSGVAVSDQITYNDGTNDVAEPNASCTVSDGGGGSIDHTNATIPASGSVDFPYDCSYSAAPTSTLETNTASAAWDSQCISADDPCSLQLTGDTAKWPVPFTWGTPTSVVHNSVTVADVYTITPTTGATCNLSGIPSTSISSSQTFNYSCVVSTPNRCVSLDNSAGFTVTDADSDADDTGSASVSAKVCGPVTGGLTMGFWQNKNGQNIIKSYCGGTSGTSLITYLKALGDTILLDVGPFDDMTNSSCTNEATYVYNVIKAATCSSTTNTCNTMLKAQMLATALDVYFSTASLGGNRIGAPTALGGVYVDLTNICSMIDGSGGATCTGHYNTSAAFGGTPTCQTVSSLLDYAAKQSNSNGSTWYSQVKATQVKAKDTFDSINNGVATSCTP